MTPAQAAQQSNRDGGGRYKEKSYTEAEVDLTPASAPMEENEEGVPMASFSEKEGRAEAMAAELEHAVTQIVESGRLAAWMDSMRSNGMNRWSFTNRALASMQLAAKFHDEGRPWPPKSSEVDIRGFQAWKKEGRAPRKGSKAIWIYAPQVIKEKDSEGKPVLDANGDPKTFTKFKPVPVFNVTDTDGEPLGGDGEEMITPLTGDAAPGVLTGLRDRVAAAGWSYREDLIAADPETASGTLGYTTPVDSPQGQQVVVDHRLSGAMKASVIAHEMAHIKCGHVADHAEYRKHRGRMETEAEMTAYLVNRELGIQAEDAESFSAGYIAGWSKGDPKVVRSAMDKALKAYMEITDGAWPDEDSQERTRILDPKIDTRGPGVAVAVG